MSLHGGPITRLPVCICGAPGPSATAPFWAVSTDTPYPVYIAPDLDVRNQRIDRAYGWPVHMEIFPDEPYERLLQTFAKNASEPIFRPALEAFCDLDDLDIQMSMSSLIRSEHVRPPVWMAWFDSVPHMVKVIESHRAGKKPKFPLGYIHTGRYHQFVVGRQEYDDSVWTFHNLVGPNQRAAYKAENEVRIRNTLASLVGYCDAAFMTAAQAPVFSPHWGLPDILITPEDRVVFVDAKNNILTEAI